MNKSPYYMLIDRQIVGTSYIALWAEWMTQSRKDGSFRVAETTLDDLWVSTVFLGLDHNFLSAGPPVLFETMVFSERQADISSDGHMTRYCTYDDALKGHDLIVESLRVLTKESLAITQTMLDVVRAGVHALELRMGMVMNVDISDDEALGALLRYLRECAGLRQIDVSERIGLERTSVANIECGRQRMNLHMFRAFAEAIGYRVNVTLTRRK